MDIGKEIVGISKYQLKLEARAQKELMQNYKVALDSIRKKIGTIYESYAQEGALTFAEMAKFQRLTKLEQFITDEISPVLKKNEQLINKISQVRYNSSFYRTGYILEKNVGVDLHYGLLRPETVKATIGITDDYKLIQNPETMEYAAFNNKLRYEAFVGMKANALKKLKSTLAQGFIQGSSYEKMARSIKDVMNYSASEAMRVMRTEGTRATTLGTMESYDHAREQGVDIVNVWDATLDRKTRPEHAALDQKEANADGYFDTDVGLVAGPGLSGVASFDINCFPGDCYVLQNTGVKKLYRRNYSGKLLTITTEAGIVISVTPNHPILTDKGFIVAARLNDGMYIVCNRPRKKRFSGIANIKNKPPVISEIFDFFSIVFPMKRMPGSKQQFHGDGRDCDVNVINMDRFLPFWIIAKLLKPGNNFGFAEACKGFRFFFSLRLPNLGFDRLFRITNGVMGFFGNALSFFFRSLRHPYKHRLASVPNGDVVFLQESTNNIPAGFIVGGNSLDRLPGLIFVDKILNIMENDFSGHVYNLQCKNDIYTISQSNGNGQGVVAHNCRCVLSAKVDGWSPTIAKSREDGYIANTSFTEWAQEKGIKVNAYGQKYSF